MSSQKGVATAGPVIIVATAILTWPIIVIAALAMAAEKISAPLAYLGIVLTAAAAIFTSISGISAYCTVGFIVTVIALFVLALNIPITDPENE